MTIIISKTGEKAIRVDKSKIELETDLQEFIHQNPESIPLYEIKEDIKLLILAREFPTNSGPIDALGIDQYGDLYIVETKLFNNTDKRRVVAQALDYGAALWRHANDFASFIDTLDTFSKRAFGESSSEKISSFFSISEIEVDTVMNNIRENLNKGSFQFVVLMDKLDDRLKDLIVYVNQNSQFTIYAVELEYYKHEDQEIVIPRLFGAEVKKDIPTTKKSGQQWDWDSFKLRLAETGKENVVAATAILDWARSSGTEVDWMQNQVGSFIPRFYSKGGKAFFPFSITGDGRINWNAPHQGDKSPGVFADKINRKAILERLHTIEGAVVDLDNVDGYNGFRMPLKELSGEGKQKQFFAVCDWIKEQMLIS